MQMSYSYIYILLFFASFFSSGLLYGEHQGDYSKLVKRDINYSTCKTGCKDLWHENVGEEYPRRCWNTNWDQRDPINLVDHKKYSKADDETQKTMIKAKTPKASRNIFLIRHGQYDDDGSKGRNLTHLGREQAILLGKRLAELGMKFNICVTSTMVRARETAQLILNQIPSEIPMKTDHMIDEVALSHCEPFSPDWNATRRKFHEDHPRVEAAFRKHIYRASPEQAHDLNELIVCHGNMIRYFVVRSLQLPFESWARFSIANAGFVWIVIKPNGDAFLKAFNDLGHLPKEKITRQVYKKN